MRTRAILILAGLLAMLLALGAGATRARSLSQPAVNWRVMGSAGAPASSASGVVSLNGTLGQTAIGPSVAANEVQLEAGYWYNIDSSWDYYLPLIVRSGQ